jgi:hypothetical protein
MKAFARRLAPALLLAAFLLAGRESRAQAFAVGGGVHIVNDVGSAAITSGFQTWGGSLFGEISLDRRVVFQLRGSRFSVRGSGTGAPNIRVSSATATVTYLFSEEWFHAGLTGGIGGYFLRPVSPGPGEEVIDTDEDAFGFNGGLVTIFDVGPRWDLRLEAMGHLIRTSASRKPIQIGLSVAYHF